MNKTISVILLLFVVGGMVGPLLARAEGEEIVARVLPGSFWYPFKTFGESVRTFFTFNREARAERYNFLSEMRLAELSAIMEQRPELSEKAAERYRRQQERLNGLLAESAERGVDWDDLMERVGQSAGRHLSFLDGVLAEVPEEARSGLERAREAAQQGQIQAIEAIGRRQPEQALTKYRELLSERIDDIEQRLQAGDEAGVGAALKDWRKYNNALGRLAEKAEQVNGTIGRWQAETIDRFDQLEDEVVKMEGMRDEFWQSRAEAIELHIESLRQIKDQFRLEAGQDLSKMIVGRAEHLRRRVQEIMRDCPEEDRTECLELHQRTIEMAGQEQEDYGKLGEEMAADNQDEVSQVIEGSLHQAGQQAWQVLEQAYQTAPEKARPGLERAATAIERIRQMTGDPSSEQAGPSIEGPMQHIRERVRQEIQPFLEEVQTRFQETRPAQ